MKSGDVFERHATRIRGSHVTGLSHKVHIEMKNEIKHKKNEKE